MRLAFERLLSVEVVRRYVVTVCRGCFLLLIKVGLWMKGSTRYYPTGINVTINYSSRILQDSMIIMSKELSWQEVYSPISVKI